MMSGKGICPFYKHEDPRARMLYCDGFQRGTVIHLTFADNLEYKDYRNKMCYKEEYEHCPIFKMLEGEASTEITSK